MEGSFRKIVILSVASIYIASIVILFIIFNNIYLNNITKKYFEENKYAATIVHKMMDEEKDKVGKDATILSKDKGLIWSITARINLYESIINLDKNKTVIKEITPIGYVRMLETLKEKLNSSVLVVKGEKEVEVFDVNLNLLAKTSGLAKDKTDNKDDEYMAPLKGSKTFSQGIDSFGFVTEKKNEFFFKGIRNIYYDAEYGFIGTVIVSKAIDQSFLIKTKTLTNKEIMLIKNNDVLLSTLNEDGSYVKERKIQLTKSEMQKKEIFSKSVKLNGKKMFIELIPILSYKENILGYIGVGFYADSIEKLYFESTVKFLLFLIIFSLIVYIILYKILKKLFLPFNLIMQGLEYIKEGDYNRKLEISSRGELSLLAETINGLSDEIKQREESLKKLNKEIILKNEELIRYDKLKDDFLANTSHELKTPLNGIIGLAESLADGATGYLPDSTKYNLRMIVKSGRRLTNLVNDILDFSKLKNRDIMLHRSDVDIYQLTEVVLYISKPMLKGKNVELKNNIDKNCKKLFADRNRLKQIMHNIIGNAIKFTFKGEIVVSTTEKENMMEISVADTGVGIENEHMNELFQMFGKIESDKEIKNDGAGLGLSISKKLVELHGGTIRAESEKNKGSKFIFSIPILTDQEYTPEENENENEVYSDETYDRKDFIKPVLQNNSSKETYKILIADDEIINLQLLINFLSIEGYSTVTAVDGEEVLRKVENENFDLIILDIMMPKLSGYEVCEKLRKNNSKLELPILMLTVKNQPKDIIAGFEAGANDYLTKPFEREELLSRVKGLVSLKKMNEEAVILFSNYELEKQRRILSEKLNEFTAMFTSKITLNSILEKLVRAVATILPFNRASVFIKDRYVYKMVYCSTPIEKEIEVDEREWEFFKEISERKIHMSQNDQNFDWCNMEKLNCCLGIPMLYDNEVIGIILLENKISVEYKGSSIDLVNNFASQTVIAMENINLFQEIENKNVILEENIKRLKFIENLITMVYTEKEQEKMIDYMLVILMIGLDFNYKNLFYYEFYEENKSMKLKNYFRKENNDKHICLNVFEESYEKTVLNIEKLLGDQRKKSRIESEEYTELNQTDIEKNFKDRHFYLDVGRKTEYESKRLFVYPVKYSGAYYGMIAIEVSDRELTDVDVEIIGMFANNFSLYLDKKRIEKEKLEMEKESAFRCVKCNRKLMVYKGKADFLEIKCPYCNTLNIIKEEK